MADKKLTDLTVITQANVDNNVLLYVVDVTGGTVDRQVNRANLYLAVANTWTKGQTFTPDLATALSTTPPTVPVGSGSPFFAALAVNTGTIAFATTAQTGDYDTIFVGQATLTNPSSGTITNSASLKIVGAPIASTNVTITNNYSLWVAAGVSRFDEQVTHTSSTKTPLTITAASAPVGSASEFVGGINSLAVTTAFATTAQTGDFISRKMGQVTLTNPSSGTITNASTLKITGAPIASTNVTITNNYALWVAGGTTVLQATTLQGNLSLGGNQLQLSSNQTLVSIDANTVELERTSGNSFMNFSVIPNGSGIGGWITYARVSDVTTNYEILRIGADLVNTGEHAVNIIKGGTGSLRPWNIYMNGTKLLSFDTANTITAYVNVGLQALISTYNNVSTVGLGVPALYGLDNRSGLTSADGSATTLYAVPSGAGKVFRITADIFATAFTSGTATYTITWTENGVSKTLVVTATVLNTLGTATDLINPDASTNITGQLTGTFTATVKVVGVVEQIA